MQPIGTIYGSMADVIANGEAEPNWDVNFQTSEITHEDGADASNILRFNGGVSGHAHGHNVDGYWNGMFFGIGGSDAIVAALAAATTAAANDAAEDEAVRLENDARLAQLRLAAAQPGSVAGTFGVTDRDQMDDYALTLGGAFAGHNTVPAPPASP